MNKILVSILFASMILLSCSPIAWAKSEQKPIRIALSGAFISEGGAEIYQKIANYIGEKTGLSVEIVTGLSYDTINKMLKDGALVGGFVCGLPYVLLNEGKETVTLSVAPVMKASRYGNKPIYYSDLIVRKDSPYKDLADLKGKRFAYNDELSNSGYNLPRAFFLEKKISKDFFGKITRTGSHEESIRAVANGEADFSFVDSLVLEYELHVKAKDAQAVRVIHSLGPAGVPPLVFTKKFDKNLAKKLTDAFANMHKDPEGRKILDFGLVQRFELVDDSNYQSIREKYMKAKKALEIGK